MKNIYLILGLVFVVVTILFSGCITKDSGKTIDSVKIDNLTNNKNMNTPPALPISNDDLISGAGAEFPKLEVK